MTAVKICGLSEPDTLRAAVESGARFIGFVFYPPSPRAISFDTAWTLAREIPTGVRSVALFVDPEDALLDHVLTSGISLDMIQLHGDETPERVAEIKAKYNMPVMKALRVADAQDVTQAKFYEDVADWLLFDAKSPEAPGGTGHRFDWTILKDRHFQKPWMLGGGLNAQNVAEALSILKPDAVDVSSGVEGTRGVKDVAKIREFVDAVKKI